MLGGVYLHFLFPAVLFSNLKPSLYGHKIFQIIYQKVMLLEVERKWLNSIFVQFEGWSLHAEFVTNSSKIFVICSIILSLCTITRPICSKSRFFLQESTFWRHIKEDIISNKFASDECGDIFNVELAFQKMVE